MKYAPNAHQAHAGLHAPEENFYEQIQGKDNTHRPFLKRVGKGIANNSLNSYSFSIEKSGSMATLARLSKN